MKVANLRAPVALAQQGQEIEGGNRTFQKCVIKNFQFYPQDQTLKVKKKKKNKVSISLATHSLVFTRRSPPNIPHMFGLSRTFHPSLIPMIFTCLKPNADTSNSQVLKNI